MRISDWSSDVCSSDLYRIGSIREVTSRCAAIPPFHGTVDRIEYMPFTFVVQGIGRFGDCLFLLNVTDCRIAIGLPVPVAVGFQFIGERAVAHLVGDLSEIGLQGIPTRLGWLFFAEAALVCIEEYA